MIKKSGYGKRATWTDVVQPMGGKRQVWQAHTECNEENVPHKMVTMIWNGKRVNVCAPVKVRTAEGGESYRRLPTPLTTDEGYLIYALPGGGEFVSGDKMAF